MTLSPADAAIAEAKTLRQENEGLKNRLSRLREASISISENLDTEAVLQAVVNSA